MFTFSGFKTHQELKEVSEHLTTPEGNIKPWNEFRQEILSINKDYNENYLQAEYNHVVASAQMVSKLGASEQSPAMPDPKNPTVSDSKNAIKVGEAATAKPKQQMFRCNPGLDLEVFPRKHPYLPKGCGACKYKGRIGLVNGGPYNRESCKACGSIRYLLNIDRYPNAIVRENKEGGKIIEYDTNDVPKSDTKRIKTIAQLLSKKGDTVEIMPRLHVKSQGYQLLYKGLKNTPYYGKCPDLRINGVWFEFEGFEKPWNKDKISRMLSHGAKQSDRIIIDNTKGCTHRYLIKRIYDLIRGGKKINEVWVYESGKITPIYKKSGKQ